MRFELQPVVDALVHCEENEVRAVLIDHDVTVAQFRELDERPGQWGYRDAEGGWHWKLRRWRNTNYEGSILV